MGGSVFLCVCALLRQVLQHVARGLPCEPLVSGLIRPLFLSALQSHQRLPYPVPHSPAPDVPSPQTQSCLIILHTECVCVWSFVLAGWRLNPFFSQAWDFSLLNSKAEWGNVKRWYDLWWDFSWHITQMLCEWRWGERLCECVCVPACIGRTEQDSTCWVIQSVCHKHCLYPEQDILGHKHVLLHQTGSSED